MWEELSELRQNAQPNNRQRGYPLLTDPFQQFADYSTQTLQPDTLLHNADWQALTSIISNNLTSFGQDQRLSFSHIYPIQSLLSNQSPLTVHDIVTHISQNNPAIPSGITVRTLSYLLKFGTIKLAY